MTHIVITAGGTSEPVDGVRKISNTSTGSLCARIYEALSDRIGARAAGRGENGGAPAYMVHYVAAAAAVRPEERENLPVSFYPVTDVESVSSVLEALMKRCDVGFVVHGMAVSDFRKGYLAEREVLAEELARAAEEAFDGTRGKPDAEALKKIMCGVLEHPARALDSGSKVGSQADLILSLVRTQKIIGKIKEWAPHAFLVGFKLLKNASEEELVRAAAELSRKNGCDLVLANDASGIRDGEHFGLLVKGDLVVGRFRTKREIAEGIAEHLLAAEGGV